MGLKLGQNINFRLFFRFLSVTGRDKAFWSRHTAYRDTGRDILLVATLVAIACLVATLVATYCLVTTLVATYFLSRHWSRHTAWSRHWSRHTASSRHWSRQTSCRDIVPVATYFSGCDILPDSNLFFFSNLSGS